METQALPSPLNSMSQLEEPDVSTADDEREPK